MSAQVFETQIAFVRKHFHPCSLSEAVASLNGRQPLPPNLVVVTVDDGYRDFSEVAYPILRRYRVPVTIYVTTQFAHQGGWLWFDALRFCISQAAPGGFHVTIDGVDYDFVLGDAVTREMAWHLLGDACLPLTPTERRCALTSVANSLAVQLPHNPTEEFRGMTWDEIRSLDPDLVEVGSHTCSHPVLSQCTDAELEAEIVGSKSTIERELGRRVVSFAYPNGQLCDYDDRVIEAVRDAGYEHAVVAHGSFARKGSSLLTLDRVGPPLEVHNFEKLMNGYSDVLERGRRLFNATPRLDVQVRRPEPFSTTTVSAGL